MKENMTAEDKARAVRMDPINQARWLKALEKPSKRLDPWELNFLNSIQRQMINSSLTEPQAKTLEEIYANKTD